MKKVENIPCCQQTPDRAGPGQGAQLQNPQGHDGVGQSRLEDDEDDEQEDGDAEESECVRRDPAVAVTPSRCRRCRPSGTGDQHGPGDSRPPV